MSLEVNVLLSSVVTKQRHPDVIHWNVHRVRASPVEYWNKGHNMLMRHESWSQSSVVFCWDLAAGPRKPDMTETQAERSNGYLLNFRSSKLFRIYYGRGNQGTKHVTGVLRSTFYSRKCRSPIRNTSTSACILQLLLLFRVRALLAGMILQLLLLLFRIHCSLCWNNS